MDITWQHSAIAIVSAAIDGKYASISEAEVERTACDLEATLKNAKSQDDLLEMVREPETPSQDIVNQLVVIALIERFWRHPSSGGISIKEMRDALFSESDRAALRDQDFVLDFGGDTVVKWRDVESRLDELERSVAVLRDLKSDLTIEAKAQILSYVFSSIIRVHPFSDGNGRTARMYSQYLLRRWGLDYIILPKVRNDHDWSAALDESMTGDGELLAEQFRLRLLRSKKGSPSDA